MSVTIATAPEIGEIRVETCIKCTLAAGRDTKVNPVKTSQEWNGSKWICLSENHKGI